MGTWTKEQLDQVCVERNKDFRGLSLHGVVFEDMNLERADFRSARLPYAVFKNCNCRSANFEGANLSFTKWGGSNLHRANMKDCIMQDADMTGITDFFGLTVTMSCRSWMGLQLDPGFWYGFLFYGLLMKPPTEEAKEKLMAFFGEQRFQTLRDLYCTRQM